MERALTLPPGDVLIDDVITPQETGHKSAKLQIQTTDVGFPFQNDRMSGLVEVSIFPVESDGGHDANTYTWTDDQWNTLFSQATSSFSMWSSEAQGRGISLSFYVGVWFHEELNLRTGYEPITHDFENFAYLWIDEIMQKQTPEFGGRPGGYGASPVNQGNVIRQVAQYCADQAHAKGDDHYFVAFIVNNPPPAASTFADGSRGGTIPGGPYFVEMWNTAGWGPDQLNLVIRHETGHIFYACDEYGRLRRLRSV